MRVYQALLPLALLCASANADTKQTPEEKLQAAHERVTKDALLFKNAQEDFGRTTLAWLDQLTRNLRAGKTTPEPDIAAKNLAMQRAKKDLKKSLAAARKQVDKIKDKVLREHEQAWLKSQEPPPGNVFTATIQTTH